MTSTNASPRPFTRGKESSPTEDVLSYHRPASECFQCKHIDEECTGIYDIFNTNEAIGACFLSMFSTQYMALQQYPNARKVPKSQFADVVVLLSCNLPHSSRRLSPAPVHHDPLCIRPTHTSLYHSRTFPLRKHLTQTIECGSTSTVDASTRC